MKRLARRSALLCCLLGAAAVVLVSSWTGHATETGAQKQRVLSIGGSVTEIVFALGQGHRVIARDTTSSYPETVTALPDVGYKRMLTAEGVLSVAPDLIIAEEGSGPQTTLDVLNAASIPVVQIPEVSDGAGIARKIRLVGEALGVPEEAESLARQVEADIAQATQKASDVAADVPKKVLFILSAQGGRIMASGAGTSADAIIAMAGGVNAVSEFEGYKPMTDEAVIAAAPDVILMMDRGGNHSIADDVLLSMPAVMPTPAAQNNAVVRMNGLYILGFGPRTADAVKDLNAKLYGS